MRLKANIGIATGTVFIGYVGSSSRGEYTEYGVMVNMAARFMGQATNEVLTNETTHDKALQTDRYVRLVDPSGICVCLFVPSHTWYRPMHEQDRF